MAGETMQKCVQALKSAGCQVTFEDGGKAIRVVFADGAVRDYSTVMFTLLVTRVLMEEAERLGDSTWEGGDTE